MYISIRFKIVVVQVFLVSMVSVFIYNYYPNRQKEIALMAINGKIKSISNMFSIGVGIGMGETDFVAVSEALSWANNDSSVVYISVVDKANQPIASFNPDKLSVPEQISKQHDAELFIENEKTIFYKNSITYQSVPFGTLIIGYSLNNLEDSIDRLKETTLYFCLVIFILGVIISWVLTTVISRNITVLDAAVKSVSEGAEDIRVSVTSNDEIGKLAKAFNHMLDKIESSRTALVNYSTRLKKHNEELNQFSYVVSHDLKAPLRAIFKLSEWIEEDLGPMLPAIPKKNLQTLKGRVTRMEALINGLLEYSKVGKYDTVTEKTDTYQIIKETIDILNPPKNIKINIGDNMPLFKTKKILLQQVFSNLLSNAIKHNNKDVCNVNIEVRNAGDFFEFTVEDDGMGIDKAYHKKIFEIFQTLEARDKVEGTGIGLSIVKKCIEDLGGSIVVESDFGKGSKFIFTWPREIIKSQNHPSL